MKPLLCLLLAVPAVAQLPDAPLPASYAQPVRQSTWREIRTPLIAMWGANAVDVSQTCIGLNNGGREISLPTQTCAGAFSILMGERIAVTGLAYWMAKHGHPRPAKILLWGFAAGSVRGSVYSFVHWNDPLPKKIH